MAEYLPDFESEDEPFYYEGRPYLFEPEYTDEELLQIQEQTRIAREGQRADEDEAAAARTRISEDWWCSCGCCNSMPTEEECLCYNEWDLLPNIGGLDVSWDDTETTRRCVTTLEDFPPLINRAVLDTFFHVPKINWRRRPKPQGPNGQLSIE